MGKITTLVINGCSFTCDTGPNSWTWASALHEQYPGLSYHNLAASAAGNDYICDSTINFLEQNDFDPDTTLVLVMWSGTGRKDLKISGEWWYHLKQKYRLCPLVNDEHYYLSSGGLTNSWTTNRTTKKIFDWLYRLSDPNTLCQQNLMNFMNLENYLQVRKYQYRFTSFVNYWHPAQQSNFLYGDYSIGYFCKDHALLKNYNFSNWFFVNENRDCLAEFAQDHNGLSHTNHPTRCEHGKFCQQIVLPVIQDLLAE